MFFRSFQKYILLFTTHYFFFPFNRRYGAVLLLFKSQWGHIPGLPLNFSSNSLCRVKSLHYYTLELKVRQQL